jgi:hypothetical protein
MLAGVVSTQPAPRVTAQRINSHLVTFIVARIDADSTLDCASFETHEEAQRVLEKTRAIRTTSMATVTACEELLP